MNAELTEFLRSQWGTASPTQYGSQLNPIVEPQGQRLPNGTRTGASGLGAPVIGVAPEVPVTAETLGIAPPQCPPKMTPIIGSDGRWVCVPQSQSGGVGQIVLLGVVGYLAYSWWKDREKGKRHTTPKEEESYDE